MRIMKNIGLDSKPTLPELWDQNQLAEYLGKSTAWCERARWAGDGPKFIRLGRHVRYRVEDVSAWIEEQRARGIA
jgi:predicted DNA-binding transcriptional regulator AlpA